MKCPRCGITFSVMEDEQNDVQDCPNECFASENEDEVGSVDACGSEIQEGDEYLEWDGEIILVENAAQYLVEILGAKQLTA